MTPAFLALGSNLGNREENLHTALERLGNVQGIRITRVSSFHDTAPVGPPQPRYLNAACAVKTSLSPRELLDAIHRIEDEMGRKRDPSNRWGPRNIDIDLLFYGDRVIDEEDFRLPHPEAHRRAFVLRPMSEIAPDFRHPVLHRTMAELMEELSPDDDDHDDR